MQFNYPNKKNDFNWIKIEKIKNHPPSPVVWYITIMIYPNGDTNGRWDFFFFESVLLLSIFMPHLLPLVFVYFFILIHSCCSNASVLVKTLMHEFLSNRHTEWSFFSGKLYGRRVAYQKLTIIIFTEQDLKSQTINLCMC